MTEECVTFGECVIEDDGDDVDDDGDVDDNDDGCSGCGGRNGGEFDGNIEFSRIPEEVDGSKKSC